MTSDTLLIHMECHGKFLTFSVNQQNKEEEEGEIISRYSLSMQSLLQQHQEILYPQIKHDYRVNRGEFYDQGDAKWIVIRGPSRGYTDTPFGRPTPGRPIGRPGVGRPKGVFGYLVTIN
jgi:hypothetical protein